MINIKKNIQRENEIIYRKRTSFKKVLDFLKLKI